MNAADDPIDVLVAKPQAPHKRLPVLLDHVRVATPCPARWDQMVGDERMRHCGDCKKNVYNLSGMTRVDVEALVNAKHGDLCVRYYQRADGTILLSDCAIGVTKRRRRRIIAAGAAALLAGGVAVSALTSADKAREGVTAIAGGLGPLPPSIADRNGHGR